MTVLVAYCLGGALISIPLILKAARLQEQVGWIRESQLEGGHQSLISEHLPPTLVHGGPYAGGPGEGPSN